MKFIVNSSELLKKLQLLNGVVPSSSTIPIIENFLFDVDEELLKITASDLETTISTSIKANSGVDACIAVPSKLLIEMLKTFPEQPIEFEILQSSILEISSNSGKYQIAYYPGEEFPRAEEPKINSTATIGSKILSAAISKTLFATGTDKLRPMMTGVYFQLSPNGAVFAATDAHKLVEYVRKDIVSEQVGNFIMPKKPLGVLKNVLANIDQDVTIEFNEINAKFTFENYTVHSRLIDAEYPNYQGVIPKDNPNKMIINRIQFLNSLKCVSIFSQKETHQIKLKVAGMSLNISAEDRDYSNKADETLICNYEGSDIEIGFNSRYLIEILNNISSEDIQLEMSIPSKAGILRPTVNTDEGEEILMLVMPSLLHK